MARADVQETRHTRIRALYGAHRDAIARQISVLTRDADATDDLVNETFIRAYEALEGFRGASSERTWLHGIALNVARNHRAKRRRRAAARLPEPENTLATPEDVLREQRALARFHDALDGLPDNLREVFVLRYVQQLPLKDVARLLSLATSTAHARASRAESMLRASVEGSGTP
ncbi:MAG: RNA polymerase sigma factor [Nannocystales bacterium]